ncbi:MAG: hypothetical protein CMM58_04980 [Rhodospirillaceae bacterium]|nr:hypothetical protein [Rhodospirillaceae bacterium]|tara:strand:+ start:187 stop:828 length:642 start_codon:yes stop_codon:yes gene_type:complete
MMDTYKVIFFGDSFTACRGLPQPDTWPSLVSDTVSKYFKNIAELEFRTSTAIQENTRGALERVQKDILFAEPDVVTIQYGTNDSTHWISYRGAPIVSQEAFRANLTELVDKCRRFGIQRVVLITNHPVALDRYDINGLTPDENTQIYDKIVREVAANCACHLADVRTAMEELSPGELCLSDEIHVTKFGAKVYAETIAPVMVGVLNGLISLAD